MLLPVDVGRVLTYYDLGTLENVSKAFHGFVNETIFVTTTTGRYVMRRNHRRFSEETHRYRHALIRWLGKNGFPTSQIIPTKTGDTLLVLDGRTYEVAPFIEAHDYDPNHPSQNVSVGKTLARYHQAIRGFDPPPGDTLPRYSAHDVMALSERLLERDIMGDLYHMLMWYDLRAAQIRRILPDSRYANLPHVLIHGDVHRDNFLFQGDKVAALIDFDQATWDARISDLADLLVGFSTAQSPNSSVMAWGVYKGPIELEGATRMLAAYQMVNPLDETEIKTLPLMIELVWLQGELGRVFSTPEGAPEYHTNVLEQGKWLSEWMQKHYDEIVKRWLKLPTAETNNSLRLLAPAA
jgi:homoserine kinase type II